ncbi:hypothetical protein B566_EDAN012723 [Ephemera danica]|nr:hypothetical protein B566_EDAN012723 [Ephemera danica]
MAILFSAYWQIGCFGDEKSAVLPPETSLRVPLKLDSGSFQPSPGCRHVRVLELSWLSILITHHTWMLLHKLIKPMRGSSTTTVRSPVSSSYFHSTVPDTLACGMADAHELAWENRAEASTTTTRCCH